ncbi:MAG: Dam family site-specific DNA-(adenine-N6)-methyltransferase [Alphaproteobacteria bacterium]|nr:Dam family site-specific DNA-(adenine-N6)-methyltransferase [Alphaproteobacteria bacterium]MDA8004448.1 Dam family site-specific DNA-(adenine-N6)-methyltransferase [Alphaproteobacteria bacterium]MDA8005639.1 Dam family site-specific DNA-(adenine-N6)-methyltransferase [Alphaproteobacteria bacterium]MDA8013735.1 Dam family site-specific DNA-(adenine-N6)-methyltransferase [Alphaproteobacteria bacterium]
MATVPPIKSQGIKTKLSAWIKVHAESRSYTRWIEPFMGTGSVVFNVQPEKAILCDTNPHLINFYNAVKSGSITSAKAREHLSHEGSELLRSNGEHYYIVRNRFNATGDPLDFLFLSRSCFNGMMRFSKRGNFNVPFCKKPNRFAPALVTKICNQIENVSKIIHRNDYQFLCQDFQDTIDSADSQDMIYCDPPYIGRHVDYFDSWDVSLELRLRNSLVGSDANFMISTWLENKYRKNSYIGEIWGGCYISTIEHFYHVGAKESNRNKITEALLTNYSTKMSIDVLRPESNVQVMHHMAGTLL